MKKIKYNELSADTKSSLKKRVITALVMAAVAFPCIILGNWVYFAFIVVITLLASYELVHVTKIEGKLRIAIYVITMTLTVLLVNYILFRNNWSLVKQNQPIDAWEFVANGFDNIELSSMLIIFAAMIFFVISFVNEKMTIYYVFYFTTMIIVLSLGIQSFLYLRYSPFSAWKLADPSYFDLPSFPYFESLLLILYLMIGVMMNDIGAYFVGILFGKHKMNPRISPKKTWEGFIGGFFTTILWGFLFTNYLLKFESLLCPVTEIGIIPFKQFNMKCENIDLKKVEYTYLLFGKLNIEILNIHIHAFSMSLFAGIFAPLGGLFASGFKRGIGIKDFADTIPGHGGLTDRMDCQLLMGIFTYVWIRQFVFFDEKKIIDNLLKRIELLNYNDKIALYKFIGKSLGF